MSEEKKTTAKIVLGGEEIEIKKLKAGKFYEAQKEIAGLFKELDKFVTAKPKSKTPQEGEAVERGESPKEEAGIDISSVDIASLTNLFEKCPDKISGFVAICADMPLSDLLEKAYPEEITVAFNICLELNNVMENLKNSVAPIGTLGAKVK